MNRQEIIHQLQEEYTQRRRAAQQEFEAREQEILERDPEIGRLREQSASLVLQAVREMSFGRTRDGMRELAQKVREQGLAINQEIAQHIARLGLPADAFQVRYQCQQCQDTGYVGDAPARFCTCFQRELARRMSSESVMTQWEQETFETFDETVFPEENNQRKQVVMARSLCEKYADTFPNTAKTNLVLLGTGGLGKTFLLNCIGQRVSERGYSAMRVTAFRMQDAMRARHMGEESDSFSALLEVPLLLIDDLGTEPMLRNITVEYLFTLLNERYAAGRHTVIATNLTMGQMSERYGERIMSRIFDRMRGDALRLTGKDVRFL